jgi:HAD superfamily hydrolase (TIGR01458 family)
MAEIVRAEKPIAGLATDLREVEGLLLDLDGVVYIGAKPLPGSLEAIARLRDRGVPLRFVTNTSRRPRRAVVETMARIGLRVDPEDLFTPAGLVRDHLVRRGAAPLLVIHPDLAEDFAGLRRGEDAVVIGDAGDDFTYSALNRAFRAIMRGADFIALANNRNFLDADGELSLDVGGFVAALEYGARRQAKVFGKPSREFFHAAVQALGLAPQRVLMIGDDAEADVGGAMAAGLKGALVRTGKYRPGAEAALSAPPTLVADDLAAVADLLLTPR